MKNNPISMYEAQDIENEDADDIFEAWEAEAHFFNTGDWGGLVEFRQRKVKTHPGCQYTMWSLGEAYVLNGEYRKAIEYLGGLHLIYPDDLNIQYTLLDALKATGKDETAFQWIIKPSTLKLDQRTLDYCYEYLRTKRKPRSVIQVYGQCYVEGYPMFSEEQLMRLLDSDDRFLVERSDDGIFECLISANRKGMQKK